MDKKVIDALIDLTFDLGTLNGRIQEKGDTDANENLFLRIQNLREQLVLLGELLSKYEITDLGEMITDMAEGLAETSYSEDFILDVNQIFLDFIRITQGLRKSKEKEIQSLRSLN